MSIVFEETLDRATEKELKSLYKRAFPASELKPYWFLKKKVKLGKTKILAVKSELGEFLGLAILFFHKNLVLLDYLAVLENRRSQGIGGLVIQKLSEEYSNKRIIIEIEDTEIFAKNIELRLRRKDFYLRSGAEIMDYKVMLFGVGMHLLTLGGPVSFLEYHELQVDMFSERTAKRIFKY